MLNKNIFLILTLTFIFFLTGCAADLEASESTNEASESKEEQQAAEEKTALTEGIDYIKVDRPADDFLAWDFEGNEVRLSDFRGNIVYLYFWATWCGPCREKLPVIQEFYDAHKDENVVLLAVSSTVVELRGGTDAQAAQKQVQSFIEGNEFTFPVLLDRNSEAWDIYQQRGIPVNYIIDKEGIVRFLRPGAYTGIEQMRAFLDILE